MALSSGPQDSSQSHIFQNSPTIPDMRKNRKYRKTLRNYQGALEDGMMVMLEDLEGFPAPVLCSFCEKPVITRTKSERSGFQWFLIGWATMCSAGLLTYPVASQNKSIVHVCPACDRPLATRMGQINDNGFTSYTKVHKYYSANNAGGKGGGGHTATSFQASGYSIVHVGNQNYFMPAAVEGLK